MARLDPLPVRLHDPAMKPLGFAAAVALFLTSVAYADPASTPAPVSPVPASPAAKEIVEKSNATYAALSSYSSTGQTETTMTGMTQVITFTMQMQRPGFYRVDWKSQLGTGGQTHSATGSVWSDGTGDFLQLIGTPQKMKSREMALAGATGVSGMAASTIPGTFFAQNWGNVLNPALPVERKPDEKLGAIDCFVVSNAMTPPAGGSVTTTLWIGQQDNLIHQSRMEMKGMHQHAMKLTDEQIGEVLKMQNKPVTPEAIADMRTKLADSMEKAEKLMAAGPVIFTQTQDNIVLNKTFVAADFTPSQLPK